MASDFFHEFEFKRVPSNYFNSHPNLLRRSRSSNQVFSGRGLAWAGSEVIPDSEEERERIRAQESKALEIIEISSDSDDENCTSITMSPTKPSVALPQTFTTPKKKAYTAYRRIIQSSDEDSDIEFIKDSAIEKSHLVQYTLSDEDSEEEADVEGAGPFQPLEDDGIIVFDEPRGAAKPLRVPNKKPIRPDVGAGVSDAGGNVAGLVVSSGTPVAGPSKLNSTPVSRRTGGKGSSSTPRSNAKKAKVLDKQNMLQGYAENLFSDLNGTVFKGRLPTTTKVHWNKRLLKTAGRAKYHRSRDGVETVEIELAEKILDCEERIRNTLSHEMCHLATWIIDGKIDEHHGKLFMKWAGLVMKKYPDIHVSVRHDYDIAYPFNWKCEKCDKIYGRFSKSIRTDKCVCGACKEGKLIPLFESKRTRKAAKVSKFAAINAQDPTSVYTLTDTDSEDSVVEALAGTLAAASITL